MSKLKSCVYVTKDLNKSSIVLITVRLNMYYTIDLGQSHSLFHLQKHNYVDI